MLCALDFIVCALCAPYQAGVVDMTGTQVAANVSVLSLLFVPCPYYLCPANIICALYNFRCALRSQNLLVPR